MEKGRALKEKGQGGGWCFLAAAGGPSIGPASIVTIAFIFSERLMDFTALDLLPGLTFSILLLYM
jgi:hypothetical protein